MTEPALHTDPTAPLFDFDVIDVALARHYGMRPAEVDALWPRDCVVMLEAGKQREKDALAPAMLLLDGMLNYHPFRSEGDNGVRWGHHYETLLESTGSERRKSRAARAKELALELKAARAAKWGITEGEA